MRLDPLVPLETTRIPTMLLQPFIENAIKHGLLKRKGIGVLKMHVRKLGDDQFRVIIEDNGIGIKKSVDLKRKEGSSKTSGGLDIISARVRLCNEREDQGKLSYTITDLSDTAGNPAGTRVEVTFPL